MSVPTEIRSDPMARALMAASLAARAHDTPRLRIFPFASTRYAEVMEDARWMDAYAVGNFGQHDRCHHFCAAQHQLRREGFLMFEIGTWIGGYAVRDTMNDGRGTVAGGRIQPGMTQAQAVEWARAWHAQDPERREVIAGFGYVETVTP